MTDDEITRWTKRRRWRWLVTPEPLRYKLDTELGMMVCVTEPAYAECQGEGDPVCGRARFSVHGCGGSPSRAEYVAWQRRRGSVAG